MIEVRDIARRARGFSQNPAVGEPELRRILSSMADLVEFREDYLHKLERAHDERKKVWQLLLDMIFTKSVTQVIISFFVFLTILLIWPDHWQGVLAGFSATLFHGLVSSIRESVRELNIDD